MFKGKNLKWMNFPSPCCCCQNDIKLHRKPSENLIFPILCHLKVWEVYPKQVTCCNCHNPSEFRNLEVAQIVQFNLKMHYLENVNPSWKPLQIPRMIKILEESLAGNPWGQKNRYPSTQDTTISRHSSFQLLFSTIKLAKEIRKHIRKCWKPIWKAPIILLSKWMLSLLNVIFLVLLKILGGLLHP